MFAKGMNEIEPTEIAMRTAPGKPGIWVTLETTSGGCQGRGELAPLAAQAVDVSDDEWLDLNWIGRFVVARRL